MQTINLLLVSYTWIFLFVHSREVISKKRWLGSGLFLARLPSGFSETKNDKIRNLSGKKSLIMICFAPLEPFEKNEQQLMQDMTLSASGQLHVDFDDDALRGEKSYQ